MHAALEILHREVHAAQCLISVYALCRLNLAKLKAHITARQGTPSKPGPGLLPAAAAGALTPAQLAILPNSIADSGPNVDYASNQPSSTGNCVADQEEPGQSWLHSSQGEGMSTLASSGDVPENVQSAGPIPLLVSLALGAETHELAPEATADVQAGGRCGLGTHNITLQHASSQIQICRQSYAVLNCHQHYKTATNITGHKIVLEQAPSLNRGVLERSIPTLCVTLIT